MCRAPDISVKKKSLRIKQWSYLNRFLAHFCAFRHASGFADAVALSPAGLPQCARARIIWGISDFRYAAKFKGVGSGRRKLFDPGQINLSALSCRIPCLKNNDGQQPQRRPGSAIGSVC
jgi:hypothetical protein